MSNHQLSHDPRTTVLGTKIDKALSLYETLTHQKEALQNFKKENEDMLRIASEVRRVTDVVKHYEETIEQCIAEINKLKDIEMFGEKGA